MERENRKWIPVAVCAAVLTVCLLLGMLTTVGTPAGATRSGASAVGVMDQFDRYMTNQISNALDGVLSVDKVYWLSDEDPVAPEPDPDCYGETDDPSTLQWLLDDAADLLDGQETLFTTETVIKPESTVKYYLDDSIFVITWKEIHNSGVYTFSEVKIAHGSQFRRFLAGGEYDSGVLYTTTDMAASVNAVTASSGDYYSYRRHGMVAYNGEVLRFGGKQLDNCLIDDNGDLHFIPQGQFASQEDAEKYVRENNIRFSLSFGPILIEDGNVVAPKRYPIGEIEREFSRAALCQQGQLHYVTVTANTELHYYQLPTIADFAQVLQEVGVKKAYTLDGGQTATIVIEDALFNDVEYGCQRDISDIIYFATAVPDGN